MPLTIAIIAKNASQTIEQALQSAEFAEQIVVVDNQSTDTTRTISQKYTTDIVIESSSSLSLKRNLALKVSRHNWIFYLDTDEVITSQLRDELQQIVEADTPAVYRVTRKNHFLGAPMYDDQVERLFHRSLLSGWHGDVHESATVKGNINTLNQPLLHYTHTDITSMLAKTNQWSEIEADLRINAKHPPVAWWRLIRIALTTMWHEQVKHKLYRFGRQGLFEAYFQMIDKLIVYTKLWEKQHSQ